MSVDSPSWSSVRALPSMRVLTSNLRDELIVCNVSGSCSYILCYTILHFTHHCCTVLHMILLNYYSVLRYGML